MNELEERVKHLEQIVRQIEMGKHHESDFDKLYKILEDEYWLEGGEDAPYVMGNYRHNLEQTIEKQAHLYIHYRRKRPKKGAPAEYASFVRNFKQDVTEELFRCQYKLRAASGENKV